MAATTEAKAAEPKEIEEIAEPTLKYKTWVLRVSVHCEGCRKKVTKTLKNIDGVYKIEVDMRQQKVTVTGNVEAETLIKKLTKTGKHAELWPQPNPNNNAKDKKKNKGKGKEKEQPDSESPEESSQGGAAGGGGGGQNEKETAKVEVVQVQDSAKKNGNEGGSTGKKVDGGNSVKASEGGGAPAKAGGGGGGQVKEAKAEVVRQSGNVQNQPPVVEKNGGGESDCEAENSAGGGGAGGDASGSGGKKKKKGQKGNAANVEVDEEDYCDIDDAPPNTGLPNRGNVPVGPNGPNYQHVSQFPHGVYGPNGPRMPPYGPNGPSFVPAPANHGLPPQQVYEQQYPRQYYRPPVQAVSYNTAYPSNGASHYATPAPNFHSHTYAPYQSLETELEQQYYPSQPSYGAPPPRSDSLELFSDENPNGCKIM